MRLAKEAANAAAEAEAENDDEVPAAAENCSTVENMSASFSSRRPPSASRRTAES